MRGGYCTGRCATVVPDAASALEPALESVAPIAVRKAVPTVDAAPHLSRREHALMQ